MVIPGAKRGLGSLDLRELDLLGFRSEELDLLAFIKDCKLG